MLLVATTFAQPERSNELRLFPVLAAWNLPVEKGVAAPPAFVGHRAFVPVEGGSIVAYDLEAGEELWTAAGATRSVPASGDGLLFLAEVDTITALSQATGDVVWRLPYAHALAVPLVWDNGWLIGADIEGHVLAVRASDGDLIWLRALDGKVRATPALAADRVYVAVEDGRVIALDVSTGAPLWERRIGGPPNDMLALADRIYVGSDDNFLYCILAADGEVDWRWRTGGDVIGVPVADEHRVYFVSKDNVLRGLDRRSGSQRWQRSLAARPTRGPVKAGDVLLISGLAPRVSGFAMKDGAPNGNLQSPGELAAGPFVTDAHGLPQVVLVARDINKGTRILAVRRTIDPPMNTPLPVLPNAITIAKPGTPGDPTAPQAPLLLFADPAAQPAAPRR